jgi:hypothetical protein
MFIGSLPGSKRQVTLKSRNRNHLRSIKKQEPKPDPGTKPGILGRVTNNQRPNNQ